MSAAHASEPAGLRHEIAARREGEIRIITGFGRPMGVSVGPDRWIYVCDMDLHAVFRLSPGLDLVCQLGAEGWSQPRQVHDVHLPPPSPVAPSLFNGPHALAFSADGGFCVTAYYEQALHFHGPDGRRISTRQQLSPAVRLEGPATAMQGHGGELLVSEYRLGMLFILNAALDVVQTIGGRRNTGEPTFDRLHMARRLADGTILVADTWNERLVQISPNRAFLRWWGATGPAGASGWHAPSRKRAVGATRRHHLPVAIDIAGDGATVLVTDWAHHRLLQISLHSGQHSVVEGLDLKSPYDARYLGGGLVVADSHNHRVLITDSVMPLD